MKKIPCLLLLACLASPAHAAEGVALGAQSNAPRFLTLKKPTATHALKQVEPGHFLALPPRSTKSAPITITRGRSYRLPERGDNPALTSETVSTAAAPKPAAPPKESDAAMGATVATQAAVSRQGAQLTDPIDLLLANKAKK